jgi:hypothetical protein
MKVAVQFRLGVFLLCVGALAASDAQAGQLEISTGLSYSRSNYSPRDYSWTRRWGASVGYNITETTQFEIAFQDVLDRTKIENYEDTTFRDRIYSANWVQGLTGRSTAIQPYFKLGIGQLNRDASGTYQGGFSRPPSKVDSLTGIIGAGMRIFFTRSIAVRMEGASYLTGGSIGTWKENFSINVGFSLVL